MCDFSQNNILIFGDQGSGKSTLARSIAAKLVKSKQFHVVYYFGATSDEMINVFGKNKCFKNVDTAILDKIIMQQKKRKTNILMIFDDVMSESNAFHYDSDLKSFFSTLRHYRITCIFSVQHLAGISPIMRRACKHVYFLTINNDVVNYLHERTYLTKKQIRELIDNNTNKNYFYYCFKNLRN